MGVEGGIIIIKLVIINNNNFAVAPPPSGYSITEIWIESFRIWKCWFLRRLGENLRVPGEKPLGPEKRINNKLNPHNFIGSSPRIDPQPHQWEASALSTARSLLPQKRKL